MLVTQLNTIDSHNRFPIPDPSPLHPIDRFELRHLQRLGLKNLYKTCCHLSLVLCFHQMGLIKAFRRALPSQRDFFIQTFLESWIGDKTSSTKTKIQWWPNNSSCLSLAITTSQPWPSTSPPSSVAPVQWPQRQGLSSVEWETILCYPHNKCLLQQWSHSYRDSHPRPVGSENENNMWSTWQCNFSVVSRCTDDEIGAALRILSSGGGGLVHWWNSRFALFKKLKSIKTFLPIINTFITFSLISWSHLSFYSVESKKEVVLLMLCCWSWRYEEVHLMKHSQ